MNKLFAVLALAALVASSGFMAFLLLELAFQPSHSVIIVEPNIPLIFTEAIAACLIVASGIILLKELAK